MARRAKLKKSWILATLAVLLTVAIMASVNATYAYLFTKTNSAENKFVPAVVACEIDEDFINNVKTDVSVKNIGTTEAYMRMVVVVAWKDDNGKTPIAVGFNTPQLIEEFKAKATEENIPEGYHLSIQFLADAIQSQPDQVVKEAWGIEIVDGQLVPPSEK